MRLQKRNSEERNGKGSGLSGENLRTERPDRDVVQHRPIKYWKGAAVGRWSQGNSRSLPAAWQGGASADRTARPLDAIRPFLSSVCAGPERSRPRAAKSQGCERSGRVEEPAKRSGAVHGRGGIHRLL